MSFRWSPLSASRKGGGEGRGGTGRRGGCSGLFSCRLFYNRCWVPLLPLSAVMALAFLMCAKHIVWHITCSVMWIPNMNEFGGMFFHWFCFFSFCHTRGHSPVGFVVAVVLYYWVYYHYLLPPLLVSRSVCMIRWFYWWVDFENVLIRKAISNKNTILWFQLIYNIVKLISMGFWHTV